jgi:beta-lactamase regulating signal transducer with metallopeptidase domain
MMNLERIYSSWFGWILSSSWQLALLVVLVGIAAFSTRKFSPRWRYALWLLVLIKVFIPPSLTLSLGVGQWGVKPVLRRMNLSLPTVKAPKAYPSKSMGEPETNMALSLPTPLYRIAISRENPDSASSVEKAIPLSPLQSGPEMIRILFFIWIFGVLVFASFVLLRYRRLSLHLKKADRIEEGALRILLERLALDMGGEGAPDLFLSNHVTSPFLFGMLHPGIVLPSNLPENLGDEDLRNVLIHELLHWKRRDIIVGWIQVLAQAIFWFHPFVWLANARLRHERECACDEAAIRQSRCVPKNYGSALLKVLLAAQGRSSASLGFLGIFERNTKLQNRLEEIMIYHPIRKRIGIFRWVAIFIFGLLFLPMGAVRNPAQAQDKTAVSSNLPTGTSDDKTAADNLIILDYGNDTSEGKRSLAASGHAIRFQRPPNHRYVESVQIFSSRYGNPEPPAEDFHLYILNGEKQILEDLKFPYGTIERGDMKWYALRTPSIEIPEQFLVAFSFNPHQTKGIYLGFDQDVLESHSFTGLPDSGFEEVADKWDWMIKVEMSGKPSGEKGFRYLDDWKPSTTEDPFTGCVEAVYDDGESDGKQSYGGSGPAMKIFIGDTGITGGNISIRGFQIYAGRYGSGYIPEDTHIILAILNPENQVLYKGNIPYSKFSYMEKWVDIVLEKPVVIESSDSYFLVSFDPQAHQTKGIYFHYNKDPKESHSLVGSVGSGFEDTPDREWMIRAFLESTNASPKSPVEDISSPVDQRIPRVANTSPQVGATDVDPEIKEIAVTFDCDMDTRGYSWTGGPPNFPEIPKGLSPSWKDNRTCVLPVNLEPGRYYRVGINSTSYQNFRSTSGIPAASMVISFTTKGADETETQKITKPMIVDLYPPNNAIDVVPGVKEIMVTFNVPMGQGYSFTGGGPEFPTVMEGMSPYWINGSKTCVLPVGLKSNWAYRMGLNSLSHKNFQSAEGVPLDPVEYRFTTGEKE